MYPSDRPNHDPGEAGVCAAVFASALALALLRHVVLYILTFVGATEPQSRAGLLIVLGLPLGIAILLLRPSREALAILHTFAGIVLLAGWYLLKNTYRPTPVTILLGIALLPLGTIFVPAFRLAAPWKLLLALIVGAGAGFLSIDPLLRAAGPEATWFLCTAIVSAASLLHRPSRRTAWRWILGLLTAAVAVMLAAIQIKLEPMRLEWHLPVPRILEDHSTDTR